MSRRRKPKKLTYGQKFKPTERGDPNYDRAAKLIYRSVHGKRKLSTSDHMFLNPYIKDGIENSRRLYDHHQRYLGIDVSRKGKQKDLHRHNANYFDPERRVSYTHKKSKKDLNIVPRKPKNGHMIIRNRTRHWGKVPGPKAEAQNEHVVGTNHPYYKTTFLSKKGPWKQYRQDASDFW